MSQAGVLPWQEAALAALLARRARLPHALLLHGRTGTGMVEFARGIAKSLLCESGGDGPACGRCGACGWFDQGNHPDYREVRPESLDDDGTEAGEPSDGEKDVRKSLVIKIAQVRALADFMTLSTHRDGMRILVIHPADAMNAESANALLKTLEEPLPRSLIILVSARVGRLLATIKSRCRKVAAPDPDRAAALHWLAGQGMANAEEALAAAGGAPLDALALADPEVAAMRQRLVAELRGGSPDAIAAAQQFEKFDLPTLVHWLQIWLHDLVLVAHRLPAAFHPAEAAALERIAGAADHKRLLRYETTLREARRLAHHPLNARLFVEQLLLSYAHAIESSR